MTKKKSLVIGAIWLLAFGQARAADPAPTVKPAVQEWTKHTQKLTGFESKISENEAALKALIVQKNAGQRYIKNDKGEKHDILEEIVATHAALVESHENYEQEKKTIKYRYPGEGDLVERRYRSRRAPTLEQVEREIGLNGQLSEIRNKTLKKYATFRKAAEAQNSPSTSGDKKNSQPPLAVPDEDAPKKLKLSK